jgi:hypothetical protein
MWIDIFVGKGKTDHHPSMCIFPITAAVQFGIKFGRAKKVEFNIIIYHQANLRTLNLVLDEGNYRYLALSKSAVKPTTRSLTIFPTSYSSPSIPDSEKNPVKLRLHNTPTRIFIISQQLPLSPNNTSLQFQLFCCCHVKKW